MEFKLRNPGMNIQEWSKKYEILEPNDFKLEEECFAPKRSTECLDKDLLKKIAHWKSPRSAGHVDKNSDE